MTRSTTIHVEAGSRCYDICIGAGTLPQAPELLTPWLGADAPAELRLCVVADAAVSESHAATVFEALVASGADVRSITVPSGEATKCFGEARRLYDALVDLQADRSTAVVAIGGGVTGDLAGFVAATYARGLPFVQIPTTLLAMVDSSVGGKTGINHPRGKNLVGAFHQPSGVLIDTETLASLSKRDYRSGLAEVVKYGVILDVEFFAWLEAHAVELNERDPAALQWVICRSCELKAEVVREDEFETTGRRAVLNYGHTFAHAFEALAGYGTLLHGEAVAVGMVCASRLAERLGRITADDTHRQVALLQSLHLPTEVPEELLSRASDIVERMMLDKKTRNRELRFVLPSRLGHVETVGGVSPQQAVAALR